MGYEKILQLLLACVIAEGLGFLIFLLKI